jgi:filamentous hemagglutinin family protein
MVMKIAAQPSRFNLPARPVVMLIAGFSLWTVATRANPVGGKVTQGTAAITTQGSQLTIQTSANAFINWQSFNIAPGETTTFLQPSASSVVWNQIGGNSASQILGNLSANGYVILQNPSGFYIGGQAAITAHGLIMTTSPLPAPDLSSGGPWDFGAVPPTARVINYGQINTDDGGSVFVIANDIENHGAITAPGGNIGLYAGKDVLVSERPDGRGLSAQVTLPQGSVDNSGKLIADAGTIAVNAQVVNQGGLIQANSVREVNGVVELFAGDSLSVGPNSTISAKGDSQGVSAGGTVTLKSGNTYQDSAGSTIDVSGGAQGGNGGQIDISAPQISSILSSINGRAITGFQSGELTIDPQDILLLSGAGDAAPASGTVNPGDPPSAGSTTTLTLDVDTFNSLISQNLLSQIDLQATQDIEVGALWTLPDSQTLNSSLTLQAGRNITLDNNAGIQAGQNWNVNLVAGTAFVPTVAQPTPAAGTYGIYLDGSAYLQTQNGNINLNAANEVQIATGLPELVLDNGIRTEAGGNIDVTTTYGDVNTGGNVQGFVFNKTVAPYYTINPEAGGISTVAGGNVTISAGGNVISANPVVGQNGLAATDVEQDGGTGAFGPQAGNVTITAGGSVFGDFVLANGIGAITALNGNVGADSGNPFALSLISGNWNVNTPNGNIYVGDVRNPNGVFNSVDIKLTSASRHLFNYAPTAALNLDAGDGVYLTGTDAQRPDGAVPVLYPPSLSIVAGPGGVVLENTVTLFPSADGNLDITTTGGGSLFSNPSTPNTIPELLMSDSGGRQWLNSTSFTDADHGATPLEIGDPNPVMLNISGDMENLTLITAKQTEINVAGDMINCGFSGENLSVNDITSINVGGRIFNASAYAFELLNQPIANIPPVDLPPGAVNSWSEFFNLALNPAALANVQLTPQQLADPSGWAADAFQAAGVFTTFATSVNANPGFVYNTTTARLGFTGQMSQGLFQELTEPLVVLQYGANGFPLVDATGHFITQQIDWVPNAQIQTLFTESQSSVPLGSGQLGYRLGGPGTFDVTADSISLGNSYGILSCGVADPQGGLSGNHYANLASMTPTGATINVTVTGDLDMLTSTIAAIGGGNVNVTSLNGSMDLGSEELFGTSRQLGFGVFTSGAGNVNVTADQDVDVDGSRIAAFDGGDVFVESLNGDVNAGSGGATITGVVTTFVNPLTGKAGNYPEDVFGSGILAYTLTDPSAVPGAAANPGNITVLTPKGDIVASLGGILQEALNGNVAAGPTITLTAGSPGNPGNIDLGDSGVIGGTVNLTANGNINGLVISRQDSTINAAQNFSGTVLSAGTATLAAAGSISGTVIGVGGVSATSGSQSVTASLLGQNVSVNGGAATSTLGTSAAASAASQSAANQANADTQQQVASNNNSDQDDLLKKKGRNPILTKRVSRVTVILPKS